MLTLLTQRAADIAAKYLANKYIIIFQLRSLRKIYLQHQFYQTHCSIERDAHGQAYFSISVEKCWFFLHQEKSVITLFSTKRIVYTIKFIDRPRIKHEYVSC